MDLFADLWNKMLDFATDMWYNVRGAARSLVPRSLVRSQARLSVSNKLLSLCVLVHPCTRYTLLRKLRSVCSASCLAGWIAVCMSAGGITLFNLQRKLRLIWSHKNFPQFPQNPIGLPHTLLLYSLNSLNNSYWIKWFINKITLLYRK